eukprot:11178575-Lingulodinium_polyedra.AAC.1
MDDCLSSVSSISGVEENGLPACSSAGVRDRAGASDSCEEEAVVAAQTPLPAGRGVLKHLVLKKPAAKTLAPRAHSISFGEIKLCLCTQKSYLLMKDKKLANGLCSSSAQRGTTTPYARHCSSLCRRLPVTRTRL